MCNTKNMKKNIAVLLPLCFLTLIACDGFNFGFNQGGNHEPGLNQSLPTNSSNFTSYSYYAGALFDEEDFAAHFTLTFTGIEKNASNLSDLATINSYVNVSDESVAVSLDEVRYLGTKDNGSLFSGTKVAGSDGLLKMIFNVAAKAVLIEATPYSFINNAYNQEGVVVDKNVAIAVNDSGYILLAEDLLDEDGTDIVTTECKYELNEQSEEISIKVANGRAFIKSITVYYS